MRWKKKFKQPLDQLGTRLLFKPYGMRDTRFVWDARMDESRFAIAHSNEGKPYDVYKNKNANAADLLLTTIVDYATFAANVMKGEGLSKAVFAEMIRPQVLYPGGKNLFFGLGWMVLLDSSNGEYALRRG